MEPVYACHSYGKASASPYHKLEIVSDSLDSSRNLSHSNPLGNGIPTNFPVSNINSTLSVHNSLGDPSANQLEVAELQANSKGIVYSQIVDDPNFTRTDFVLGKSAYKLVYEFIVKIFQTNSCIWK